MRCLGRLLGALALLGLAAGAAAQEPPEGEALAPLPAPPIEDLELLMDRPFDPGEYRLGPADLVTISTTGEANLAWTVRVTPDGTVVIPTVGAVPVLGLSLDEAEERIEQAVLRYYRNLDVHITLAGVRRFKVFVVGDIEDPGAKLASAATRVSELVPPRRNILVQRASGDTLAVDVVRFVQTGDLRYNPTLLAGDVLVVPQVDERVEVYGRVFFPGTYEYRAGETLAELLRVVNGYRGFPSDAHDVVYLSRFVDRRNRELTRFSRDEAIGGRGAALVLQPFDAVYVPLVSDYKVQRTATAEGEVRYPGVYPIRPDTTTVRDLVEMAGGFTEDASLVMAQLRRRPIGVSEKGLEELLKIPPELLSEEEQEILQIRQMADPSNVVVDFQELFLRGEDVYNLTLRAGDSLVVPEERRGVTVLGAVQNPGIVGYAPDRSLDDYVELAGDYTDKADEGAVTILKAKTAARVDEDDVAAIESGDTIVVPFEEPRDWWEIYTRATTIVTGIASLVLAFIAATR